MEEAGKPVATLVDKYFGKDSKSAASRKGMPGLRTVSASISSSLLAMEDVAAGITPALDDIVLALTKPLTDEEKTPTQEKVEKSSKTIFSGNIKDVNQLFYRRGWTDGLPIIPPTEEAVAEMMTGTDLPPDHVVSKIVPRMGNATVEKIAINAVMAGALPTYMPVLIAMVKAIEDPHLNYGTWGVSTGSWVPFWIINGPIRKDLHINSGQGALSPGDIANATIGRAMGLITKNIGGIRKGVEDMATLGHPGRYSCVIAEAEEDSPWEPLHVEKGFEKEDSTVSVSFPNVIGLVRMNSLSAEGILSTLSRNPTAMSPSYILTPKMAKELSEGGYNKTDIKNYLLKASAKPSRGTRGDSGATALSEEMARLRTISGASTAGPANRIDKMQIIVAGGAGNFFGIFSGGAGDTTIASPVKIELPANWKDLVEKYKDIAPTYEEY